jgi:hypothetical protein
MHDVANAILCGMHTENRIGEAVITNIMQDSMKYGSEIEKKASIMASQIVVNDILSGLELVIVNEEEEDEERQILPMDNTIIVEETASAIDGDHLEDEDDHCECEPMSTFRIKSQHNKVDHIKLTNVRLRKVSRTCFIIISSYYYY